MHVGTRLRITLHDDSKDFVITDVQDEDIYAASVLDANTVIRMKLHNAELSMPEAPEALIALHYAFSGNLNVNIRILAKVDAATLNVISELDAGIKTLVQNNDIWYAKVEIDFGEAVLRFKPQDVLMQDFYKSYSSIQRRGAPAALLTAAENNNLPMLKIALNAGADVNVRDEFGNTALMLSSWRGHVPIVQELIRRTTDVNATSNAGWTALMDAAENGHLEVMKELIQAGANMNIVANGRTALTHAALWGHRDIVNLLRQHGAQ